MSNRQTALLLAAALIVTSFYAFAWTRHIQHHFNDSAAFQELHGRIHVLEKSLERKERRLRELEAVVAMR